MKFKAIAFFVAVLITIGGVAATQSSNEDDLPALSSPTFEAFGLRNIGPAFMSGRIADIAIWTATR